MTPMTNLEHDITQQLAIVRQRRADGHNDLEAMARGRLDRLIEQWQTEHKRPPSQQP